MADFDGDRHLDVAIAAEPDALHIYPGNGDFTFDARVTLTTGAWPNGGIASDLNSDGRPDLAIAARDGHEVDVFMNGGGFLFGSSAIPLDRAALDVTAADLNRDGRSDLIVSAGTESVDYVGEFFDGRVLVMIGNGDGTFQPAAVYETPEGPVKIAAGDFNRDGLTDVATGNFATGGQEECGSLWGSVSILPGNGTGALGAPASFQGSYDLADTGFNKRLHSLNTARLDADQHLDLIISGAILLNRSAALNRTPVAWAGDDQTINNSSHSTLATGVASDPDNDLLSYRWTDEAGRVVETCVLAVLQTPGPGEHTFTFSVSDGRGGTAADSMTVTDTSTSGHNPPALTVHRPGFDNPVPANTPYTIKWSASDPDGFPIADVDISVDRNGQTNFEPIPECTNLPGTATECTWTNSGPPSNDAALLFRVTDSQGDTTNSVVRFQIVEGAVGPLPAGWANGDVGAVAAAGSAGFGGNTFTIRGSGADIWGTADEFHWAFRRLSGDFEVTTRVVTVQNVNSWTKAGLMIRESNQPGSRHASIFATPGTEKPVAFQRRRTPNGASLHTAGPVQAPPVWLKLARAGDSVSAFYRTTATGDWIVVDTQTIAGLAPAVQVGLAVSSHVDGTLATATFDNFSIASSAMLQVQVLRPRNNEQVQTNASYTIRWMPADSAGIAKFDLFFSQNPGGPWSAIAECTNLGPERRSCIWRRPSPVGPGFVKVVTTTDRGLQGEARSDPFRIVVNASGPGGMPPGWMCGDVGSVEASAPCKYEVDDELVPDFVLEGSGADIWATQDEFKFAAYLAYGDFSITARVLYVENVNRWTKAGIMIRDWDGERPTVEEYDRRHASIFVTPTTEKGTAFQRRPVNGGGSVHTSGPVATAPVWLKLVRSGDAIRAYYRKELTDRWTLIGTQVFTSLPYQLSAMLVVSSHVDGTLAAARFDNVVVDEPEPMQSADIGATAPGRTTTEGLETTIEGNGGDIWGSADAFRFSYTRWNGNGTIMARVRSLEDTHAWAKAGIMFRESLAPGSKHVMAIVSSSRGLAVQSRSSTGGVSVSTTPVPGAAPVWLALRRFEDRFEAGWSEDGELWHSLGATTISMNADLFVGLPVTSHSAGTLATAVFDDVLIRP